MKNTYVRNVGPCAELHRDRKSGIAWIEDGSTGLGHSCHANIDATGSVRGMKALGYWGKEDRTVRSHGFIYNIDTFVVDEEDPYDALVAEECQCASCIERRGLKMTAMAGCADGTADRKKEPSQWTMFLKKHAGKRSI